MFSSRITFLSSSIRRLLNYKGNNKPAPNYIINIYCTFVKLPSSVLIALYRFSFRPIIALSNVARIGGNRKMIINAAANVPSEIVLQIFAAIADAKFPTIAVTIIKTDADVRIV